MGDGDQARDCRCAATSVRNALRRAGDSDRHWRHRVGAGTPLDQVSIREPQRDIHTDTRLNLCLGHGICNSVELGIRHADRIGIDFGTRAGTTNGGEASLIHAQHASVSNDTCHPTSTVPVPPEGSFDACLS